MSIIFAKETMGLSLTSQAPDSSQELLVSAPRKSQDEIWHDDKGWPEEWCLDFENFLCTVDQNWNFLENLKFQFLQIYKSAESNSTLCSYLCCRFFWKRLISFFLICKNRPTLWRITHFINGFCITEKMILGIFKKNGCNGI